jgi:hypothetical protein
MEPPITAADSGRVQVPVITLEPGREAALAVVCSAHAGRAACLPAWLRASRAETKPEQLGVGI